MTDFQELERQLQSDFAGDRVDAVEAAARSADPRARELWFGALYSTEHDLVEAAVHAVVRSRDAEAARELLRAFEAADEDMSIHIVGWLAFETPEQLGWLRDETLSALSSSSDSTVRAAAADLLVDPLRPREDELLFSALETALTDRDAAVRERAAESLQYLRPPPLIETIREKHREWLRENEGVS